MIDIKNINYRYPGSREQVFDAFSLHMDGNRIYGLLGKNGTGKSTMLSLVAGLLRPQKGTVTVMGAPAAERRAEVLSETFFVSEEFELPAMTLSSYTRLMAPLYPHFSHDVLQKCLDVFELPHDMQMQSLSMGQKKKVQISIALASGTRLLLLDEPTNGMDIPSKSQFRKIMAESMAVPMDNGEERTIIISTHQVHDVEQLLDHIVIISNRELLMDASVADITDRYVFEMRPSGQLDDSIIYAEPSLQGNIVMARRDEGDMETTVNLELLFNAVTKGLVK